MENSNTPWTPGPWYIDGANFRGVDSRSVIATSIIGRYSVAYQHLSGLEQESNTRLIAAAPEMAEALRYARNLIGPDAIIDALLARIKGADHGE